MRATESDRAEIHCLGRFDWRDPEGPRFEWSGTTLIARFFGTGIAIRLRGAANQFAVRIDDAAPSRLRFDGKATSNLLVTGLERGEHRVQVSRRTEASFGAVQLLGFEVEGGALLDSPAPFSRSLELLGDSITCGYGNEAEHERCGFDAETENETLAFGALAAQALDATHTAIAWSGRGVRENYGGDPAPTMPELYRRVLPSDAGHLWDFNQDAPDLVVIHLGTNDAWRGDPGEAFTDAYEQLLTELRALRPHSALLAVMAPEPLGVADRVAEAVRRHQERGERRLQFLRLAPYDPADGYGSDSHPSLAAHRKMAAQLVAAAREMMAW